MARNGAFKFLWHCEREEITQSCFVDDLMTFCKAEVGLVRKRLNQVWVVSGLSPNLNKSNMFMYGIKVQLLLDDLKYKGGMRSKVVFYC